MSFFGTHPHSSLLQKGAFFISLLVLTLSLSGQAFAKKKKEDSGPSDLDRINLAKLMLRDGHGDRALAVLQQVNRTADGVIEAEYWFLLGLAQHGMDQWLGAEQALTKAIEIAAATPDTGFSVPINGFIIRASALIKLKRPQDAVKSLEDAPPEAADVEAYYLVKSNAYYLDGNKHEAFNALDAGYKRLAKSDKLGSKRILMLVDLGLYQSAVDEAQVFFNRVTIKINDYIALATALIEAKQIERAILLLEQAALLYPEDIEVRSHLARAYFEDQKPLAAGDILYPVGLFESKSAQSAAELYVKAGRFIRAQRMNARVDDQQAKTRQRLIILLEQSHFEAAAALDRRIERLGLLKEEKIAYALAYAHYRSGNFKRMEQLLSLITEAALFRKSIELRRSAEECRQSIWKCD